MSSDDVVRARIERGIKERAVKALEGQGLTLSDVIRELLVRIARDGALPFGLEPSAAREIEARGRRGRKRAEEPQ